LQTYQQNQEKKILSLFFQKNGKKIIKIALLYERRSS
jgi:hypothetical protein